MHVLDDLGGVTPRARAFLRRAWVDPATTGRLSTDFKMVVDRTGRLVAAPLELVVRREAFAARFGGLRYHVRRSVRVGDLRLDSARLWRFDLDEILRAERGGWSFGWYGEHVSSPVSHLVHTDGRVGVRAAWPFLEVWSSWQHMIEDHALVDEVADWEPVAAASLEDWTPVNAMSEQIRNLLTVLPPVAEASGPRVRWWRSEDIAVRRSHGWTDAQPRPIGIMIWSRTGRI